MTSAEKALAERIRGEIVMQAPMPRSAAGRDRRRLETGVYYETSALKRARQNQLALVQPAQQVWHIRRRF